MLGISFTSAAKRACRHGTKDTLKAIEITYAVPSKLRQTLDTWMPMCWMRQSTPGPAAHRSFLRRAVSDRGRRRGTAWIGHWGALPGTCWPPCLAHGVVLSVVDVQAKAKELLMFAVLLGLHRPGGAVVTSYMASGIMLSTWLVNTAHITLIVAQFTDLPPGRSRRS